MRYLRVIKSMVYLQRLGQSWLAQQQVAAIILQRAAHEKRRNAAAVTIQVCVCVCVCVLFVRSWTIYS